MKNQFTLKRQNLTMKQDIETHTYLNTGNLYTANEILNSTIPIKFAEDGSVIYEKSLKLTHSSTLIGDMKSMRMNYGLLPGEDQQFGVEASYNREDPSTIGHLLLTNYRILFKFSDPSKNKIKNYSKDYFMFPFHHIKNISLIKPKDKSDSYTMTISLKDTRDLNFYIWDNKDYTFYEACDRAYKVNPKDRYAIYNFPKIYGKSINNSKLNGWNIYDPIKEFNREGLYENNDLHLRFTKVNMNYELCETYPQVLVTYFDMSDADLKDAAKVRTKNRIPALTYYYNGTINDVNPSNNGFKNAPGIWRCSQFKGGLLGSGKNDSDKKYFLGLDNLADQVLIMDARPYVNALANRATGGGYENIENYTNTSINFCNIANIHVARESLAKVYQICLSQGLLDNQKFWSDIEATGWYEFVYLVLKHSCVIVDSLVSNHTVLVHCSDGWDRTSQLSSLPQIMIDPYFRTIEGFAVLIEKDWLSFGHQFGLRNGIYLEDRKEDQDSPIFLQWLDCVHQLLYQFPCAFEFNENLLVFIAKNIDSNLYGTFMYNSQKQRDLLNAKDTASIWTDVFNCIDMYKNPYYNPVTCPKIIRPNCAPYKLQFWDKFFMDHNCFLPVNQCNDIGNSCVINKDSALVKLCKIIKDNVEIVQKLDKETKEYVLAVK